LGAEGRLRVGPLDRQPPDGAEDIEITAAKRALEGDFWKPLRVFAEYETALEAALRRTPFVRPPGSREKGPSIRYSSAV
jgi:hypothetical protein